MSDLPDRARQRLRTAAAAASIGGAAAMMLAHSLAQRLPKPVRDASAGLARNAAIAAGMVPGGERLAAALHRLTGTGTDLEGYPGGEFPHLADAEPGPFSDVLTGVDEQDLEAMGLLDDGGAGDDEASGDRDEDAASGRAQANGQAAGRRGAPETAEPAPAAKKKAASEPAPASAPAEEVARADLPLPDYDHLSLGQLRSRLRRLTADDLRVLRDYEQAHAHRAPVLTMFGNRIAKLDSGAAQPSGAAAVTAGDAVASPPPPDGGSQVAPETAGPPQNPPTAGVPTNPAQPR